MKQLLAVLFSILFYNSQAQENYTAPKEEIQWAMQFSGISGPGLAVEGDGRGGWKSGSDGVYYSGSNPKPEYNLNFKNSASGSAVDKGLVPPIVPAIELHLRDGVVTLGGDGNYYLTGSSGDNIWAYTKGVELWKSPDLKKWEYVGLVWDIDKEADEWVKKWRKHPRRAVRAVWAPEIHFIKGNYFICYSMCPDGIGLLKSATGKPEGPYINAFKTTEPIADGIDATLFEDDNGQVYFTYGGGGKIAPLKDDLSDFAGPFKSIVFENPDVDPKHHAASCEKREWKDLGHEGAILFKRNGKYYLGGADTYEGRYSSCIAVSDNIYGPYVNRHESIPCGGGTGFFKDKKGNWWCSYFGNDTQSHFREKVSFVKVEFTPNNYLIPAKDQPFVSKENVKNWNEKWNTFWKNRYNKKTERK